MDVKFYEIVFPFKTSIDESVKEHTEVYTLNFFDHFESEPVSKTPSSPNEDEEGSHSRDSRVHQPVLSSIIDQLGHNGDHSATLIDEQNTFEGNVGTNQEVNAMNDEMHALYENKTWTMTDLPFDKKPIGSKWVCRIKYKSNGEVERYKARLVAKGFSQKEDWKVYQMDINDAFLYGDLNEEAPKQWNHNLSKALLEACFVQSKNDHSLFIKNKGNVSLYLLVYVDDLVINGSDVNEIEKFKSFLNNKFKIKDLGELKPVMTPLPENIHMHDPLKSNFDIAMRVLKHLKLAHGLGVNFSKRKSDCLITAFFDSDEAKCPVTRRSVSAEAKYRSMASTTCEIMWVVKVLNDFGIDNLIPANLYCDNKSEIQIAANLVMHEKTTHFDIDVHLIREKVYPSLIKTIKVDFKENVADILTKTLGSF
ncbi:ribonuclease H-like domain-containing protein [Tanacetum coccineum]